MKRIDIIEYLNSIKPFLNLSKVCELYNELNKDNPIDYNNLRKVLNESNCTRLSDDKLMSFVNFLQNDLYHTIFKVTSLNNLTTYENIKKIVNKKFNKIIEEISEEIKNGI